MNQHSSLTNHFRSWFDWCFCNRLPVQVLQQIRKKWESRGAHRVHRARVNFLSLTEVSVFRWGNEFDILFWTSQKKDVGIWGIKHILVIHTCHCEGNSSLRGAGNKILPIPYDSRCQSSLSLWVTKWMPIATPPVQRGAGRSKGTPLYLRWKEILLLACQKAWLESHAQQGSLSRTILKTVGWICVGKTGCTYCTWGSGLVGFVLLHRECSGCSIGRAMEKPNFIPWKIQKFNS